MRPLLSLITLLALAGSGCVIVRATVNPSPGLRWWLFSKYGSAKICPELLDHGVPLRLHPHGPAIGRFFPSRCSTRVHEDRHTVTVSLGGTGYGFSPLSGRVGFALDTAVEYRMDVRLHERGTYVWGVLHRIAVPPRFTVLHADNPVGTMGGPFATMSSFVGQQLVEREMSRGFTVLHTSKGNLFALGRVRPPHRPFTPFSVSASAHYTYANETIELAVGQRDFLGPFDIVEPGQRLRVTYALEGGAAIEVMVVTRATGRAWREAYQHGSNVGPPGPIVRGMPLSPGRAVTVEYRLPRGSYNIVVDHTREVGRVAPPPQLPGLSPSSRLSYIVQLVE